jgi:predicted Zn-dependent protease with MMP-like domain
MSKWEQQMQWAKAEVADVLAQLPAPLREKAEEIPVIFEIRPSRALVRDGIAADTMGLFEGGSTADAVGDTPVWPTRILLFLENIAKEAGPSESAFRREVRTTLLHELGHYLGLDEDALDERGLA